MVSVEISRGKKNNQKILKEYLSIREDPCYEEKWIKKANTITAQSQRLLRKYQLSLLLVGQEEFICFKNNNILKYLPWAEGCEWHLVLFCQEAHLPFLLTLLMKTSTRAKQSCQHAF